MPVDAVAPLTGADFADLMRPLGPFESSPHLAIAVSGGADSMALALLAQDWAVARGGLITALIVDHQLRPDSRSEAEMTARRLAERSISAVILTRQGPAPSGDIQAVARAARYRLLLAWCRDNGVLHLLTAHHLEDQAETFLLRLGRGSGLSGLAAMPAIAAMGPCQLLRPLLPISTKRLRATLASAQQDWIDDPSNNNETFARVRLRKAAPVLAGLGLDSRRLADTSVHLARARTSLSTQTDRFLAETTAIHPAGFAVLRRETLCRVTAEVGLRALAALLVCVGGQEFPPRFERLQRLFDAIIADQLGAGRTLAGCRIVRHRDGLLIYRELASIEPSLPIDTAPIIWDNRFALSAAGADPLVDVTVRALGATGTAVLRRHAEIDDRGRIPIRVWPSLPSLWRGDTMICVPHLAWVAENATSIEVTVRFRPKRALTECGFTVV